MHHKKYLVLMRHAKSDHSLTSDFDRPLNQKGQEQVKKIAKKFRSLDIKIDKFLVSPSLRTTETCKLLLKELKKDLEPIFESQLYNAHMDDILSLLAEYNDEKNLMIIGHNPSISLVCEYLSGNYYDFHPADIVVLSTEDPTSKRFHFEQVLSTREP